MARQNTYRGPLNNENPWIRMAQCNLTTAPIYGIMWNWWSVILNGGVCIIVTKGFKRAVPARFIDPVRCPRQCPCQDGNDAHKPENGSGSGNTYFRECNSCSSRCERQIWERIPLRELYSAIFLPAIVFDFCWAGLRIAIVNCVEYGLVWGCKNVKKCSPFLISSYASQTLNVYKQS